MKQLITHTTGALLFRQMATVVRRDLPLRDMVEILARDPEMFGRDTPAVEALGFRLRQTDSLADALKSLPELVPPETAELVREGAAHGMLGQVLDAIADDYIGTARGHNSIRASLAWPKAIAVLSFVLLAAMMIFVIPAFKEVFASFGGGVLPGPTLLLIAISDFFVAWWWILVGMIAVFLVLKRRNRLPVGLAVVAEKFLLGIPFVRIHLANAFTARLTRWLNSTHHSPQVLVAAVRYVQSTERWSSLALCAARLESRLIDGSPLGQALAGLAPIPMRLALLAQFGELVGELDGVLAQAADYSEAEAESTLVGFERGIVVSLYLLLGVIVGTVVIGMYLPIFKLGSVVG